MAPHIQDPAHDVTVADATGDFATQGYSAQFAPVEGAKVRCFACRNDSEASAFAIDAMERTEGASDPADMVANVAAQCPSCGARGVLTLKYGPESSFEEQEVLLVLEDHRSTSTGGTTVE
jgi:hypothetical protein